MPHGSSRSLCNSLTGDCPSNDDKEYRSRYPLPKWGPKSSRGFQRQLKDDRLDYDPPVTRVSHGQSAFHTDYDAMKRAQPRIVDAYLMVAGMETQPGGLAGLFGKPSLHTAVIFKTDDGRYLIYRGGAGNEPTAANFKAALAGTAMGTHPQLDAADIMRLAGKETTYDFGPLIASLNEMPDVAYRPETRRSEREDQATRNVDTVNFHEINGGKGILRPRPNVKLFPIAQGREAKALFGEAVKATHQLNQARYAYNPLPNSEGSTGINSHTTTSWLFMRMDEKLGYPKYMQTMGSLGYIYPGFSSSSATLPGPSLEKIRYAVLHPNHAGSWAQHQGKPQIGGRYLMRYALNKQHREVTVSKSDTGYSSVRYTPAISESGFHAYLGQ